MTVQELINVLQAVPDKSLLVCLSNDPEGNHIRWLDEPSSEWLDLDLEAAEEGEGDECLVLWPR